MQNLKDFIYDYKDLFTFLILGIFFYFLFFHNIWAYALMDIDETRYVSMSRDMFYSKDFLTLYLNNEYFFEKPPLYFWGECLSFAIFGKINELTARFPVALYGTLCAYLTYFMGKKIVSRTYGFVSSLILATSMEFLILAKFAILDIVVTTCIWFSLCFGICVYFCKEHNKKYFWWLFYIFSGLAVMAKGIPGFVVPFGAMFLISIFTKKFKEIFKLQYFIPGVLLFMLIVLPWHIIMFKLHNPLFYNEYIIKHHIARFFNDNELGRERPFYFYIVTILWGFLPWIISLLPIWTKRLIKRDYSFENLDRTHLFLAFNVIISTFILLFFTVSDTKLITYILPMYGSLACLGGYVWMKYIKVGKDAKIINITVYVVGIIFIIAAIAGLFTPLYLPKQLLADISSAKVFCITLVFATGLASILFAKKNLRYGVFITYVLFMVILSAFGTKKLFEIDYKFGQNDLMQYAEYAKENNKSILAYHFTRKYSLIFYGNKPVEYNMDCTTADLKSAINEKDKLVIIPRNQMDTVKGVKYKLINEGRKYILVE